MEIIVAMLPKTSKLGRPVAGNRRKVMNGLFHILNSVFLFPTMDKGGINRRGQSEVK
jgi:hypothetical protein